MVKLATNMGYMLLFIIGFFSCLYSYDESETNCLEKNRLTGSDTEDLHKLVEAMLHETVKMECRFCQEMDDPLPKLWYRQDVLFKEPPVEVELDMGTVPRVRVTPDHTLVLHNVTSADTGVYQCLKFSFLLDVVESTVDHIVGNLTTWRSYHNSSLMPLNKYLQNMEDGLQFSVATEWETWGPCVACNRPEGERRRVGRCRVKQHSQQHIRHGFGSKAHKQHVMKKVSELSCHSKLLANLFPKISEATRKVPEFILSEPCVGDCSVDVRNQRKHKGKVPHYKQRHVLRPGARLTLICPEATLKDVVTWRKDNVVIMSNATQHVTVDMFSILHLADVTQASEGNYTCFVGNTRMQEVIVYIAPATNSRTEEFLRHIAYLSFVFLLNFICYCSCLCAAWKRRRRLQESSSIT